MSVYITYIFVCVAALIHMISKFILKITENPDYFIFFNFTKSMEISKESGGFFCFVFLLRQYS